MFICFNSNVILYMDNTAIIYGSSKTLLIFKCWTKSCSERIFLQYLLRAGWEGHALTDNLRSAVLQFVIFWLLFADKGAKFLYCLFVSLVLPLLIPLNVILVAIVKPPLFWLLLGGISRSAGPQIVGDGASVVFIVVESFPALLESLPLIQKQFSSHFPQNQPSGLGTVAAEIRMVFNKG